MSKNYFKKLTVCAILIAPALFQGNASAQVVNGYSFIDQGSALYNNASTPYSNTSPQGIGTQAIGSGADDPCSAAITFPSNFRFKFGGVCETQFRACVNGILSFDPGLGTFVTWVNTNLLSTATGGANPRDVIAPLWDDLMTTTPSPSGSIRYYYTGTGATDTTLTIEWYNMGWCFSNTATPTLSFKVVLYNSNHSVGNTNSNGFNVGPNYIEIYYKDTIGAPNQGFPSTCGTGASIGLSGAVVGNFLSVDNSGTASTSTVTNNINPSPAGGTNGNKRLYQFIPPAGGSAGTAPANDHCNNAQLLTYQTACPFTSVSGTTIAADSMTNGSATYAPATCWNAATISDTADVWYKVYPTTANLIASTDYLSAAGGGACTASAGPYSTRIALYTGSCASLTQIGCNDNGGTNYPSNGLVNLSSGYTPNSDTVWIRVAGDVLGIQGDFGIACLSATSGAGLTCGAPITSAMTGGIPQLTGPGYYSGAITGTTCCMNNDYSGICATGAHTGEDVVYKFTTSAVGGGTYNISVATTPLTSAGGEFYGWMVSDSATYSCPPTGCTGTNIGMGSIGGVGYWSKRASGPVTLAGSRTYYLIIDSRAPISCFTFRLQIDGLRTTPNAAAQGRNCSDAKILNLASTSTYPMVISDSTCTKGNDYDFAAFSILGSTIYTRAEDMIFRLDNTDIANSYQISLTNTNNPHSGDDDGYQGMHIFTSYRTSNPPIISGDTVLAFATAGWFGTPTGTASLSYTFPTNGANYFMLVDDWAYPDCFSFTLTIDTTHLPVAPNGPCPPDTLNMTSGSASVSSSVTNSNNNMSGWQVSSINNGYGAFNYYWMTANTATNYVRCYTLINLAAGTNWYNIKVTNTTGMAAGGYITWFLSTTCPSWVSGSNTIIAEARPDTLGGFQNSGTKNIACGNVQLTQGSAYYITVSIHGTTTVVKNFQLEVTLGGNPTNDRPEFATMLTLSSTAFSPVVNGTTVCASATDDAFSSSVCGPNNIAHQVVPAVWYKFIAPASHGVWVYARRTSASSFVPSGSAFRPGIALFDSTQAVPDYTLLKCSTGNPCDTSWTTTAAGSDFLYYNNLTPGDTCYLRISSQSTGGVGAGYEVGDFDLTVDDMAMRPPLNGSDCSDPIAVCASFIAGGTFNGWGNFCDSKGGYPYSGGTGPLSGSPYNTPRVNTSIAAIQGEVGAAWYKFNMKPTFGAADTCLRFIISRVQTTALNPRFGWALWSDIGSVNSFCDSIIYSPTSAITSLPTSATNYMNRLPSRSKNMFSSTNAANGDAWTINQNKTGMLSDSAQATPITVGAYNNPNRRWSNHQSSYNGGTADKNYTPAPVANGTYMLMVSNYADAATAQYTIDFLNTPLDVLPNNLTWCGTFSTDWFDPKNWCACVTPVCTATEKRNVIIPAGTPYSPFIYQLDPNNSNLNGSCNNITIMAGATLTDSLYSLDICGNIYNYGNFIHKTGTSTNLVGTTTQYMDGGTTAFSYTSAFSTLTINNTSGSAPHIDASSNSNLRIEVRDTVNLTAGILALSRPNGRFVLGKPGTAGNPSAGSPGLIQGTSPYANSYIDGLMLRYVPTITGGATTYGFPVGNGNSTACEYAKMTVNNVGSTPLDSVMVGFAISSGDSAIAINSVPSPAIGVWNGIMNVGADAPNTNPIPNKDGIWTFTAYPTAANTQYDLELWGRNFLASAKGATRTIVKRETSPASSPWTVSGLWWYGNGTNANVYTGTGVLVMTGRKNYVGFSEFGIGKSDVSLPLELIEFTGRNLAPNKNILNWNTATEINNDYFLLQRSATGEKFESIATIKGALNSTQMLYYSHVDDSPYNGSNYYRLKIVDTDGKFTYSNVVVLNNQFDEFVLEGIHPNPALNNVNFDMKAPVDGTVKVKIVDVIGNIIYTQEKPVKKGKNTLSTDVSDYKAGVYFIQIDYLDENSDSKSITSKFVKL